MLEHQYTGAVELRRKFLDPVQDMSASAWHLERFASSSVSTFSELAGSICSIGSIVGVVFILVTSSSSGISPRSSSASRSSTKLQKRIQIDTFVVLRVHKVLW